MRSCKWNSAVSFSFSLTHIYGHNQPTWNCVFLSTFKLLDFASYTGGMNVLDDTARSNLIASQIFIAYICCVRCHLTSKQSFVANIQLTFHNHISDIRNIIYLLLKKSSGPVFAAKSPIIEKTIQKQLQWSTISQLFHNFWVLLPI